MMIKTVFLGKEIAIAEGDELAAKPGRRQCLYPQRW